MVSVVVDTVVASTTAVFGLEQLAVTIGPLHKHRLALVGLPQETLVVAVVAAERGLLALAVQARGA
jgi:hypothetical protein